MSQIKNLLVLGGTGHLGKAIVTTFKPSWSVTNLAPTSNNEANSNVTINLEEKLSTQIDDIYAQIDKITNRYEAILCVAGGWVGGTIKEEGVFDNFERMINQNMYSSLLAAHLATKYLSDAGLLVLTGAAALFKDVTPEMIAYTIAKSQVHSLGLNLAQSEELSGRTVVTILPEKLDTPENREANPKADFSKWPSPDKVAGLLKMWADGENRPETGSFAKLQMSQGSVITELL